ncbi:MaoC/PaaZ C-terminal domain-containing protein [Propylenella binzhouense]|uniref:MaoC-like domain-containing protein n=1 Tax=Propylenella binzhouense TaxID=2555902 RepID=A0A964T260_9HYPH|nr:MaoC/PaaZ C-terminal domain-containing protein [Propylenella binzhouense]MYZ47023.1 hypothetical protein [Propylenella binzhouense]
MDIAALPELAALKVGDHIRPPDFSAYPIPERFDPARYDPTDAAIKAYCYAIDCQDPWYFGATDRFGERIVPSAMVLKELMWFYQTRYDRSLVRGFHQREVARYHRPVPFGIPLVVTGTNTAKYVKRGRGYLIHESEARGPDGTLYVSQINTELIEMSPPAGIAESDGPAAPRRVDGPFEARREGVAFADAAKGTGLADLEVSADRAQAAVFSGIADEFENIHTNPRIAAEMGYPRVIVQGLMNVCWLSELLTRWAGPAFLSGGEITATFLKPILANDRATIRTRIARVDGRVEIEGASIGAGAEAHAVFIASVPRG